MRVFDPTGSTEAVAALRAHGIDATVTQLGSSLMAAANNNEIAGVLIAHDADEELCELFLRAFRARHPVLPVVHLSTKSTDPEVRTRLTQNGANAVLPWPLPAAADFLPAMTALFPSVMAERQPEEAGFDSPTEAMPVDLPMDALTPVDIATKTPLQTVIPPGLEKPGLGRVPDREASVLRRKLGDLEDAQKPPAVLPAEAFEKAVQEVAQKSAENTELRGELTLIRDRNSMLEHRLQQLKDEFNQLTRERDTLLHDEPSVPTESFDELRGGMESYTHAMGAAIDFMEDLQHRVGGRAPSLDAHLRTMKLVKQLLSRLASEAQGGQE